jgi:hypothetical protein
MARANYTPIDDFVVFSPIREDVGLGVTNQPIRTPQPIKTEDIFVPPTITTTTVVNDEYGYGYGIKNEEYGYYGGGTPRQGCPEGQKEVVVNCFKAPCPKMCVPIEETLPTPNPLPVDYGQVGSPTRQIVTDSNGTNEPVGNGNQTPKKITNNLSTIVIGLGIIVGLVVVFKVLKKSPTV